MTHIHPMHHLTLHRLREEEVERRHARVRAMRDIEPRGSWVIRLGSAVAAALAAGRLAFAESAAAGTKVNMANAGSTPEAKKAALPTPRGRRRGLATPTP